MEIIDLSTAIKARKDATAIQDLGYVVDLLNSLGDDNKNRIINFFIQWVRSDISGALGLVDDDSDENPWYEIVNPLYKESAGECYFCDKDVDPNATEVNRETKLCMMCQLKLANFLTAIGFDPRKFLNMVLKPRTIQKTRIGKK